MPQKGKLSPEEKVNIVEQYLSGKVSPSKIMDEYGIESSTLRMWVRLYKTRGAEGLVPVEKTRKYSSELKEIVVQEYLQKGSSLRFLCEKYNISNSSMVVKWIRKYNNHEAFKPQYEGGDCMVKGRDTTLDERKEIVTYCIAHSKNYMECITKFGISYQQIYTWVKKYEQSGFEGLEDRRGKRKPEELLTELERAQREIKALQEENRLLRMKEEFLKKVEEIGRRRR